MLVFVCRREHHIIHAHRRVLRRPGTGPLTSACAARAKPPPPTSPHLLAHDYCHTTLFSKQFASSVLETRLNEVLRFTLGRTYGVSVQDSFTAAPPMLRPDQPLPGTVTVRGCAAFVGS